MYRVEKVLNHNVILAIYENDKQEYLIIEKESDLERKLQKELKSMKKHRFIRW